MPLNADLSPRAQLAVGAIMLVIGEFPWLYTPLITTGHPRGGDPGSGMLGTLIFLLVGLPGLTLVWSAWKRMPGTRPDPPSEDDPT